MKQLLFIIIFFCFCASEAEAQKIIKFRAKYISQMEYEFGRWSDWTEWEEANILILIDLNDERISIFASSNNYLDIYDSEVKESSDVSTLFLYCIDDEGYKCRVRLKYYQDEDERQLYIDYPNFTVVYALKRLSNY